jgi:RNA binding exosome subunit
MVNTSKGLSIQRSLSFHTDKLKALCGQATISNEDDALKIKHHAGIIVELRDEQITDFVVLLNTLFGNYIREETTRGNLAARECEMVVSKRLDFNDKVSYLDDPEEILRMREPVIRSYTALFRKDAQLRTPRMNDFQKCLDFPLLKEDLDRSEYVLKMPLFFSLSDNLKQYDRLNNLLRVINDAITVQNDKITELLERALTVLSRGELISMAERMDLSKSKFVTMGVTIEPTVLNVINKSWYGNNLSSTIDNMVDDIKQLLREPESLIARREELAKGSFINCLEMLATDAFAENVRETQVIAKTLTDKVSLISSQMSRFSNRLQNIPQRETDGYYGDVITDIARLISCYCGVLVRVLDFTYEFAEGLKIGVDNLQLLSGSLKTHQTCAYRYVELRKDKKWL